jgi:hypothetical protein
MITRTFSVVAFAVLLLSAGCHSGTLEGAGPMITATTISVDQLPAEFDGTRTYHYRAANLRDPEHMIIALWQAGFHATRAWQPLDNPSCADPLGPTFTVELDADSPAIVDDGFQLGVGRLFCATTLTEFSVSGGGS